MTFIYSHCLKLLTAVCVSLPTLAVIKKHDVSDTSIATWCETPYVAVETQEVTITFYISSEATSQILSQNLALYFVHYKDSEDEETVYICWVKKTSSTFDCYQKAIGYNLSLSGSDNPMKLIIPKASMKHAGRYDLTVDGFPPERFQSCNLTLKTKGDRLITNNPLKRARQQRFSLKQMAADPLRNLAFDSEHLWPPVHTD